MGCCVKLAWFGHGGAGVCLKGRALWGRTQNGYKAVGSRAVGNAGGGRIGVADPSGRVERGALGGGGAPPLPSSKALGRGGGGLQ